MKTIVFLLCALIALGLTSCSNEETVDQGSQSSERIEFSFSLGGEIDVETDPLVTRAKSVGANDLIGVQVYTVQANSSQQAFAYGLFDNTDNLRISLLKDGKYLFKATLLKDAKTKLRRFPNDWATGSTKPVYFFQPFHLPGTADNEIGCELTNVFTYSNTFSLEGLNRGLSDVSKTGTPQKMKRPELERYYGETQFTAVAGSKISIALIQTVFGVKYAVKNLKSGSVRFQLEGATGKTVTSDSAPISTLYTFDQLSIVKNYSETVNITAVWVNGTKETPIATKTIPFSRMMRTTLSIDLDKVGKVESGMEFTIDNGAMGTGGNVELN